MSRVSLIEQLYAPKKKGALDFDYDKLWAPPIRFFLSQQDIDQLYKIATSLKYNDNIEMKYKLIDAVMRPRGFKRANCGTNRVVYYCLEDTSFCMKIALDRVGINDSPREYKNQEFFKPFCCKIFEVDPTGVIACVERVNPISSLEEFLSISDDVFNMMVTKIIGKYVVDDLGTDKFLNYGLRYNSNGTAFGPVILDYPYAYELDGSKLHCGKPIQIGDREFACGGEIDYDSGLNNLICNKCGRTYSARELARDDSNVLKFYTDNNEKRRMRARIVRETDGAILMDSGRSSKTYMTKEEYEEGTKLFELNNFEPRKVEKTIKNKYVPMKKLREQYHSELQVKAYEEMQKKNAEPFNPVIKPEFGPRPASRAKNTNVEVTTTEEVKPVINYEYPSVRPARRAEDIVENTSVEEVTKIVDNEQVNETVNNEEVTEEPEKLKITKIEIRVVDKSKEEVKEEDTMVEEIKEVETEAVENVEVEETVETVEEIESEEVEEVVEESDDEDAAEESEELDEYDDNGNLLHHRDADGYETWFEYDENGNEILNRDSNGFEAIMEYDDQNRMTHYKDTDNVEEWYRYNEDGSKETITAAERSSEFSNEMESDVFPEINNQDIDYNEVDSEEDEEEDAGYYDYFNEDRKEKKRGDKHNKNKSKFSMEDMSEY